VDVVADHSVHLSEEEGVLLVHGWCYVLWSGRVAPQLPQTFSAKALVVLGK